jgi:hypothetical protein
MVKQFQSKDGSVREAAWQVLKEIATPASIEPLQAVAAKDSTLKPYVDQVIEAIKKRQKNKQARSLKDSKLKPHVDQVIAAIKKRQKK